MNPKKIISVVVCIYFMILFYGCHKDKPCATCPPPPPTTCEYAAGNRNFSWRIDTVAWWPSTLGGLWAFSDNDAWVMGNMCGPTVPGQTNYMGLHWNGQRWDDTVKFLDILIEPNEVIGDASFMAAVGYRMMPEGTFSTIVDYDNKTKKWKTYQFQSFGELRSVWTDGNGYFIAVGDNGMVYTKDGYTSDWVFQKAPTEFNFSRVTGVSKVEIYARAYISLVSGYNYHQYWKYNGAQWIKLYDEQDTTGTIIKLQDTENSMIDIAVSRCSITDSLKMYLVGWESFLLESKGQELSYKITNLTNFGLPLHNIGRTAQRIFCFSPNDYWIFGTGYNYYHWNGSNFMKMAIPGFPTSVDNAGDYRTMQKTATGKIFFPAEVSSQVYVVIQGIP